MIKVFISQPMKDKTPEEIQKERNRAIEVVKAEYGDCEIIDSYFADADIADVKNRPLAYLAKSLSLLANADLVVFCKGWKEARGCAVEYACAKLYDLEILDLEDDFK